VFCEFGREAPTDFFSGGEQMNKFYGALLCGALALAATAADAQSNMRIRGTISAVEGNTLAIKTREGRDMKVEIAPDATFAYPKVVKLADIKPGTPLGTSAVPGPGGKLIARELHVFPADRPVPNEGHRPWDLEPNSSMTNGSVSSVATIGNGRELTLNYKDGSQVVVVPDNVPVVTAVEADRSILKPGEYALIQAGMNNDGKVIATRVQVSKDGVRPPQ
jgi:hypothetical protein